VGVDDRGEVQGRESIIFSGPQATRFQDRKKAVRARAAARVLVVLLATTGVQLAQSAPAQAVDASAEADFVARINELRLTVGVSPVTVDAALTGVARDWSGRMSSGIGLAHNPGLRGIIDGITTAWRKLGENVGWGSSVAQLHDALVASPHHYANLVDPDFKVIGVGVIVNQGQMWVTEDFLAGATGSASPTTTSAPRPTTTTTAAPKRVAPRPTPVAPAPTPPPPQSPPPPPQPPPPPPPTPERMRIALATERLLELQLISASPVRTASRAR
jgi:uncharacterized protein YkwD